VIEQTIALLIDAYRDLNARKLFWVTMIISGVIIIAFAFVGVGPDSIYFLGATISMHGVIDPMLVYKQVLLGTIVVGIWLTWGAIILALVSTGGMFPDLIVSGAIDLYLSKPISRLRLFLTKYFTGLLFVALQVAVFSVGCFFVMGIRAHEWRPSLFLAIPLVVAIFSYLFAFSVLLGVWSRSSIAAILLTVVLWLFFAIVQWTEPGLLGMQLTLEQSVKRAEQRIALAERQGESGNPFVHQMDTIDRNELETNKQNLGRWRLFHNIFYYTELFIPKTTETKNLLDRSIMTDRDLAAARNARQPNDGGDAPGPFGSSREDRQAAATEVQAQIMARSPLKIVGSSLIIEAVVLAFAAWIFCRRDY
jgi:hypothetical protein